MGNTSSMGLIDRAWLRMDSAVNPTVITAVMFFDEGFPFVDLEELARTRLMAQPRFRSRVVRGNTLGLSSSWEEVEGFNVAAHLLRARVGPDESDVVEVTSRWMSEPLDRTRPLWRFIHVERAGAGVAVIAQVHHAVGDGVALVRTLLEVADPGAAARATGGVHLEELSAAFAARLRRAAVDVRALARLLALPHDPPSSLRRPLSGQKHIAWTRPLPLEPLLAAAHAHRNATLTDLVIAGVTEAVEAEEHRATGQPLPAIRALVPVFVHGGDHKSANRFGLVFLPLATGSRPLAERVAFTRTALNALKDSADTEVAMLVLGGMGLVPNLLERAAVAIFTGKASLLMTSVPGPRGDVNLHGHRLSSIVVSAPVGGTIGVSVSMLSHGGTLRVSVASDRALPLDPARIAAHLEALLEQLVTSPTAG
jgi:WS/DGAT/MGAT family acyltransferase